MGSSLIIVPKIGERVTVKSTGTGSIAASAIDLQLELLVIFVAGIGVNGDDDLSSCLTGIEHQLARERNEIAVCGGSRAVESGVFNFNRSFRGPESTTSKTACAWPLLPS